MSIPLATVATEFLDRPNLAKSTVDSYEVALLPLLKEYGRHSIEKLDRVVIEQYLSSRGELSKTTLKRHRAILQALLNFAVDRDYIQTNPLEVQRRGKRYSPVEHRSGSERELGNRPIRQLSPEQLQTLFRVTSKDSRMHTLLRLLYNTGVKLSELLAVDVEDLDLQQHRFPVIGKGKQSRWCYYSEDLTQLLKKYLQYYRHRKHQALFTAQHPITGTVTRLSYRRVHQQWRTITEDCPALQGVHIQDLRHTFAMERAGTLSIVELQSLLGHQNKYTTMQYQRIKEELRNHMEPENNSKII